MATTGQKSRPHPAQTLTLLLVAFLLSGCAASLVPGYERLSIYRDETGVPWRINVVDQARVWSECGPLLYGCTDPVRLTVWMIDSWTVAQHECAHVREIEQGNSQGGEWLKDLAYGWIVSNALFTLTMPIPAAQKPCGEDYAYSDSDHTNGKWVRLPSINTLVSDRF